MFTFVHKLNLAYQTKNVGSSTHHRRPSSQNKKVQSILQPQHPTENQDTMRESNSTVQKKVDEENKDTGLSRRQTSSEQRNHAKESTKKHLYLWNLRNVPLTESLIRRTATYQYLRHIMRASDTEARIACGLWHGDLSKHSKRQRWKSRRTPVGRAKLYLSLARDWIADTTSADKRRRKDRVEKRVSPTERNPFTLTRKIFKFKHADYFENNVKYIEWFDGGKWKLHYNNGKTLSLRWAPPNPIIDCTSDLRIFFDPKEPGKQKFMKAELYKYLRGFYKSGYFPSNMDIMSTLRRQSTTVQLSKDSASGKVYPNYINRLTAPGLCPYILEAKRKYNIEAAHLRQVTYGAIVFLGAVATATGIPSKSHAKKPMSINPYPKLKRNPLTILIVGAEKSSEFKYAISALKSGAKVTIVNPKAPTHPLFSNFIKAGGKHQQRKIQQLPSGSKYRVIMEDFPHPTGGYLDEAKRFVDARLSHLSSGGRWVVVTEKKSFAEAISFNAQKRGFKVLWRETTEVHKRGGKRIPTHEATPQSKHVRDSSRIILVISK